jgi:zinc protease
MYGKDNIFGINSDGTRESVNKITLEDLKAYYGRTFSPGVTKILIAGNISREKALEALQPLEDEWKSREVPITTYPDPLLPEKSKIYFVDVPGSRQSVVLIGYPAIKRSDPDFIKADFINYRLGGAFTSIFNQILREEKGYTYGAFSGFMEMKYTAPFLASSSVRSDATYETVRIFKEEMEKYRNGMSDDNVQFVKNCMIRANALRFETNSALTGMLATMAKYDLPDDYIKQEENVISNITSDEANAIINKYIIPDRMIYVVVGDAATQLQPLEKIGFGTPILQPSGKAFSPGP